MRCFVTINPSAHHIQRLSIGMYEAHCSFIQRLSRSIGFDFVKLLCCIWLWSGFTAQAMTLGSPQILSQPGQPLRVEIPIQVSIDEAGALPSLKSIASNKAEYERLGISARVLEFNIQSQVLRNPQQQLRILLESVEPIPVSAGPFIDFLVKLSWSSGSIHKVITLLIGDAQNILVGPGETLSEIASKMAPEFAGASLNQAMMALFKENPDAFASGSINYLQAGVELKKPSLALLKSINPSEADRFAVEANTQWHAAQNAKKAKPTLALATEQGNPPPSQDRLKIASQTISNTKQLLYTEQLVEQELLYAQNKAHIVELEKNIATLQILLDGAKVRPKSTGEQSSQFDFIGVSPEILMPIFIALISLLSFVLLIFLVLYVGRFEIKYFTQRFRRHSKSAKLEKSSTADSKQGEAVQRVGPVFSGASLDPAAGDRELSHSVVVNLPAEFLRLKLNLAKAYIKIHDLDSAQILLEEILQFSGAVDSAVTLECQVMLMELLQKKG
ncbi:FimV/HubP family polar landmark protein [Polynucleobacter brandtiae]|nr:FimV/HubP family polar landmark protein [Polynucleobacter brandtiae]